MNKKLFFLLIINLLLIIEFLEAQNTYFEKKYGDLLPDLARTVIQFSDSNIYILGTTIFENNAQVSLSKLDKFGNIKWVKYYGDSLNDYGINLISDNNHLILVYEKESSPGNLDIGILKTDTSGVLIAAQYFGTLQKNESPRQIVKTSDNAYAICGFISDEFGANDLYALKVDINFNLIWHLNIGGTDNDYSGGLVELADSSILIVGDTRSFSTGGYDIYLVKIDKNGILVWDRTYGDIYDNGSQGIIKTHDQKIFIYGETHTGIGLDFDFYTLLIDVDGTQIWQYNLGYNGTDAAFSAIELSTGDFVLTGYSNSNNVNLPIDLTVFKMNRNGSIIWQHYYGGDGIDIGYNIIPSVNNGILVVGQSYDNTFDTQQYLLHLNYNGSLNIIMEHDLNSKNNIYPYPNPATNYIFIPEKWKNEKIAIFDLIGNQIPFQINENKILLPPTMVSGHYILKINCCDIFKFLKY